MDTMTNLLWMLHSRGLALFFIFNPVWTLSVDVMLNVISRGECVQPVVCKRDLMGDAMFSSVTILPKNLFALGKTVHSVEGDIVLLSSLSYDENNYNHAQQVGKQDFDMHCVNCSTAFSKQRHIYLQSAYNLSKGARQSLFDILRLDNRQWDTITQSISSLLSKDKWNTHILFTSSNAAAKAISSITKSSTSKTFLFTMDNGSQLNHTLDGLYMLLQKKDLNFIVVCSVTCIVDFLSQVYQFETMVDKTSNRWLMIPTAGLIGDIVNSSMQIPDADIVVMDKEPYKQKYSVLNLNELQKMLSSLETTDISKIYSGLTDYIDQTSSSISAKVYILNSLQKEKEMRRVGHITQDGEAVISEDLFPGFKYGFKNRTLTVSTLEWPPFVYKKDENGSITYSGVCIDLLQELSRGLNFSYHIVEPEEQEFGLELNGRWTGLVGEMVFKKADLVVAPLTLLETRERVMDFTVPYFYVRSALIMTKSYPNTNKWMTLVAPFRYEVHICILLSLIISTVFLFVVEEIHPVNTWTDNRLSARWTRYGNILWYHFGALMANGGAHLPSTQAGRSVLSCWWLFTVMSAAVYSGNLIAFLTDWREKPPFTTLAQMVEQDTYKWGTLGGTSNIDIFKEKHTAIPALEWFGTIVLSRISGVFLLWNKVQHGRGQSVMLQCSIHVLVLRMNELGLPRMWYKAWSSSVKCEKSRSDKRADLLALQSAFYAAGVGVLLCLSILMTEVLYNRRKNRENSLSSTENNEGESKSETRL